MKTRFKPYVAPLLLTAGLSVGLLPASGRGAPPEGEGAAASSTTKPSGAAGSTVSAPAVPAPPAAPVDPNLRALVSKLGDDDPTVRDETTKKLTKLGKSALPALREAAAGDDPEARSRAQNLIRHIEGHIPPPGPNPKAGSRIQSVHTSIVRGIKTVDVNDNGQKVHITAQPDGSIEMTVTGLADGKQATETYKAKDAGELKRDNPEAFALYDRWANGGGVQIQIFGGPMVLPPGAPGGAPPVAPGVEQQLRDANVPPEQRERITEQLRRAQAMQHKAQEDAEQRVHDRLRGESPDQKTPQEKQDKPKEQDKAKQETSDSRERQEKAENHEKSK